MKYKSIIAFGDSHTAGCELGAESLTNDYFAGRITLAEVDSITKPLAYPQCVADRLNIPCYNYSLSGGSNERTLRLIPQAIAEHPDSLVLIGYTASSRREFYYDDPGKFLGRDGDNYVQAGMQWFDSGDNYLSHRSGVMSHPFNEFFVKHIMRKNPNECASILNFMFYAQQACPNIVHIFLFDNLYSKSHAVSTLINQSKILNFNGVSNDGFGGYQSWATSNRFTKLPQDHFVRAAHYSLSEKIISHLANNMLA
jgi:hypothetical protein